MKGVTHKISRMSYFENEKVGKSKVGVDLGMGMVRLEIRVNCVLGKCMETLNLVL